MLLKVLEEEGAVERAWHPFRVPDKGRRGALLSECSWQPCRWFPISKEVWGTKSAWDLGYLPPRPTEQPSKAGLNEGSCAGRVELAPEGGFCFVFVSFGS